MLFSKELYFEESVTARELLILAYLRINCNNLGYITTCVRWLTIKTGYVPKTGSGNSLDQTRNCLIALQDKGIIDIDSESFGNNDMLDITIDNSSEYLLPHNGYVKITSNEYNLIVSSDYRRKDVMLAVLFAIKSHITFEKDGSVADYCYCSTKTLLSDVSYCVDISHNTFDTVAKKLVSCGALDSYSVGSYTARGAKGEEYKTFPTFYTLGSDKIDKEKCINIAKETLADKGIIVNHFITDDFWGDLLD